jgi:hypothetical protein
MSSGRVNPNDSKETPFGAREIWCVLRSAANEQNASEGASLWQNRSAYGPCQEWLVLERRLKF